MAYEPFLQVISEAALVNPPLSKAITPDQEVSFIPMADVSDTGQWRSRQTRRQREVSVGYTAFQERDVLFAKITPCMENGKGCHAIGLIHGVGYGSTEFHILRAKPNTNDRFLYYWLATDEVRKKAEAFMIGSAGQQRVQAIFFDHFQIPRLDKDTQAFAARVLDTIDEAIRKTEQLIAKLKSIKQGLLHDLLTRGLDENGQLRNPIAHPEQFKDSPLGCIPKEWKIEPISKIFRIINGGTPATSISQYWNGKIPWLTVEDFNTGKRYVYDASKKITEKGLKESATSLLPESSLIISARGTVGVIAQLGRAMAFNQSCYGLISNRIECSEDYLYYFLSEFMIKCKQATFGSVFDTITRAAFDKIMVAYPFNVEESKIIVSNLSSVDLLIEKNQEEAGKFKLLKKGLMHDLLTGKVRVHNNKGDQENEDIHHS